MAETNIKNVLKERGSRYGSFDGHARVTQTLKGVINIELERRNKHVSPSQQEALDMICHKIGRIINGDADYIDSWVDIAGYAQLVVDELQKAEDFNEIRSDIQDSIKGSGDANAMDVRLKSQSASRF